MQLRHIVHLLVQQKNPQHKHMSKINTKKRLKPKVTGYHQIFVLDI